MLIRLKTYTTYNNNNNNNNNNILWIKIIFSCGLNSCKFKLAVIEWQWVTLYNKHIITYL
jgi:hypothetical protein